MAEFGLVAIVLIGVAATGMLRLGSRPAADASSQAPGTVAPTAGAPTLSSVAVVPAAPSAQATPGPTPIATPSATPAKRPSPSPSPLVYVVKGGDTLMSIARRYGVSVAAVKAANRSENPQLMVNPNLIFAGQRIVIPVP
jgi:LysM repeat protein